MAVRSSEEDMKLHPLNCAVFLDDEQLRKYIPADPNTV
jgi:hypothetical protein